jgi:hypothetical protein
MKLPNHSPREIEEQNEWKLDLIGGVTVTHPGYT